MLNLDLFHSEITKLCLIFDKQPSELLFEAYYDTLQELNDEQFKQAVKIISRSNKYNSLPKPAEFIEAIHGTSDQQKSKDEILATQALLKLEEGIIKHGYYDSVQFDDPRIHKAVEHMGGWLKVSNQKDEEWKWSKKEFIKIYQSLLHRPVDDSYPTRLIGFNELENNNRGTMLALADHLKPQTKYIGNPKVVQIESRQNKMIGGK